MLAKNLVFLGLLGLTSALTVHTQFFTSEEFEPFIPESSLNPRDCPEGMYLNAESDECENCRECGEYMYIRKECTKDSNTQCGWCGNKQVVKNADFRRKCETFSLFKELREKLRKEYEGDEDMEENGAETVMQENGIVHIVHLQRRIDEDDEKDLRLAEEEDFMNRPVVYINEGESQEDDLSSSEIDEEVEAKEVDEHDIGETADSEEIDNTVEEILADKMTEQKDHVLSLMPAEEIQQIPLKFVVTGNIQKEDDEDGKSSESSSSEEEVDEEMMADEDEKLIRSSSRMLLRIFLMTLIIVIIYTWASKFMSFSRRRRQRILLLPDLNTFSDEQRQMMDRCACQIPKVEGNCYENKLAYI